MKVHSFTHKLILLPIYYIFHHNLLFGYLHKIFFKTFRYKKYKFNLKIEKLPTSHRASFLFKTYEYNDRIICEKNLSKKNKCIVIGGGIGFIPAIVYHKTKNKVLIFEINKKIIQNLKKNLLINNCKFRVLNKNLVFNLKKKSSFYCTKNFLETTGYHKTKDKIIVENIYYKKIKNILSFNTLIIDGEGIEEYYIKHISSFKNIKYILFELHNNLISKKLVKKIFNTLSENEFVLSDKCFNSYYYEKILK